MMLDPGWVRKVRGDVVIISGGATGDSVEFWAGQWPRAHFVLFEPTPSYLETLRHRFAGRQNVTISGCALSDIAGPATFNVSAVPMASSLLPWKHDNTDGLPFWREVTQIQVETVTLDGWCAVHGIGHVGYWELDVQGAELHALRGARQLLRRHAIDAILVEVFYADYYDGLPTEKDIDALMIDHGYHRAGVQSPEIDHTGRLHCQDIMYLGGTHD